MCSRARPLSRSLEKVVTVFQADTEADDSFTCVSRWGGPHDLGSGKQAFVAAPAVAKMEQLQRIDKGRQLVVGILFFEGEGKKPG